MKKLRTSIFIVFTAVLLLLAGTIQAQQYNTMYHLDLLPQSNQLNPAFQGDCNFYLGMPAAAPTMRFYSGLTYGDVFYNNPDIDSVVTFMYNKKYQNLFLESLDRSKNLFETGIALNYLSLGFRVNKLFFSLDHHVKVDGLVNLSSDFARFILQGNADANWNPINYDLSNTDIQLRAYHEFGVGVSYRYDEQWTFGIRPKIYNGIANVSMDNQNIRLNSTDSTIRIVSGFEVNATIPTGSYIEDDTLQFDDGFEMDGFLDAVTGNRGLGIDLGATYQYDDKITFSASILDLGYINWKEKTYNVDLSSDYTFKGIDITGMITGNEAESDTSLVEEILDSLQTNFDRVDSETSFRDGMYGKIYLGGSYQLYPWLKFGVLSRTQFINKSMRQQLTLSTNLKAGKMAGFALSYTMMNNTYNNLGIGFSLKPGPFNFFFVADKAFYAVDQVLMEDGGSMYLPHSLKNINFRFGFNLMFGCREQNQPEEPMVE